MPTSPTFISWQGTRKGFQRLPSPGEREDVKGFLQNEIGLEELFVDNLLHN